MKVVAVMPCYKVMDIPAVISLTAMMSDIYSRGDHFTIAFSRMGILQTKQGKTYSSM